MFNVKIYVLLILSCIINCSLIFELKPGKKRCYIDELFENSVLMVKWKIFKENSKEVDNYLKYIKIIISSEETKRKELEIIPTERKSKTSFSPKKEGQYRICTYFNGRLEKRDKLYMNLKFGSDNMDEPKLADAVKSTDINKMEIKVDDLLSLAKPVIKRKKKDVELENLNSRATIHITRWYKRITYFQIILCIIIGSIQVNNFRNFLKSQNII